MPLLLPVLDTSEEHYRPFSELYGGQPSKNNRPSGQISGDADAVESNMKHKPLFISGKVQCTLHCSEWYKPTCVYKA